MGIGSVLHPQSVTSHGRPSMTGGPLGHEVELLELLDSERTIVVQLVAQLDA